MEILALIVVMGVIFAILFGIPFGVSWILYQKMKKHLVPYYLRWTAIIPAIILLFFLGKYFFPEEHSYKMDYWEITAYPFPPDGQLIYQDTLAATDKDGFDFGMTTNKDIYKYMWDVLYRRGFNYDSTIVSPSYVQKYMQQNNIHIYQKLRLSRYPKYNYYAEFLSDSSTIFFRKIPK